MPAAAPDEVWDARWEARWAGHGRAVRGALTAAALALCAVVATVVVNRVDASVAADRTEEARRASSASSADSTGTRQARTAATLELVRDWDARRAQAWRIGDADALARLYVRGASAGRADVALLRQWKAEGWTIENAAPQLLRVAQVEGTPRRLVVDVTDRLSGLRGRRGEDEVMLPATGISTRRIVFVEYHGTWRVKQVSAA